MPVHMWKRLFHASHYCLVFTYFLKNYKKLRNVQKLKKQVVSTQYCHQTCSWRVFNGNFTVCHVFLKILACVLYCCTVQNPCSPCLATCDMSRMSLACMLLPLQYLFANGRMLSYSTKLDETLEVQTTDLNNGSEAKGNITVIAMYSNTATGTSKNSTAINIPGAEQLIIMCNMRPSVN